ncbi:MAG TPA: YfhO family protein [Elusimicrobiota bacterium]|nr:YfhO family protein [Elusimicrobiota bacterium]
MRGEARFPGARGALAYLLFATLIGLYAFKRFIFGGAVYLYKDIGADSINVYYTQYAHLLSYLAKDGVPGWSFNQGLGQNIYPFSWNDPFQLILLAFGRSRLAYGIFWMEAAKIGLGGIFFSLYLRALRLSSYASVAGGLLFSFSGYVVVGGEWAIFSTEAVYCAFLLYAFERFLAGGDRRLLPWPIAGLALLQPYLLAPYAFFFLVYGTARFVDEKGWDPDEYRSFLLRFAGAAALGAALGGVMVLSECRLMLQSPRTSGAGSFVGTLFARPVFGLAGARHDATAALRFFSDDLQGNGSRFSGWRNYLEAPLFYCGLVTLLLVPQAFAVMDRKRRVLYGALTAIFLLPVVFPYFRFAFWAFRADYYRTLSFLIAVILLFLGARALSRIDEGAPARASVLAGTVAAALVVLFAVPRAAGISVDGRLRAEVVGFLCADAGLLFLMGSRRLGRAARAGLLLLLCVEAAVFTRRSAAARDVVTAAELGRRTGYNDYTVDAVARLKAIDASFYRVEKDYRSGPAAYVSLNDAKIQDYYGTSSYVQFNQPYVAAFLSEMGLLDASKSNGARWQLGTGSSERLMSLVGVKYFLTKRPATAPPGPFSGDPVGTFGDVRAFRNRRALPLAFTYSRRFPLAEFRRLDKARKDALLLNAFVIDRSEEKDLASFAEYPASAAARAPTERGFDRSFRARTHDAFVVAARGQNSLDGTISLARPRLLFFSIPYDAGWSALVDGRAAALERADVGFMGLALGPGKHRVELRFEPPYRAAGALLSLAALALYGLLLLRRGLGPRAGTGALSRGRSP